jgi:glycosyltransferase involved in cell wall biosynthesis
MKMNDRNNILFLETGTSGKGGSYRSLKEHIQILHSSYHKIVIVLVNDSIYEEDYRKLGCEVVKLYHPIYSINSKLKIAYRYTFAVSLRISQMISFGVQYLFEMNFVRNVELIIKKYDITHIHLNDQPMRNFAGFIIANRNDVSVISHIRTLSTYGFTKKLAEYAAKKSRFIAITQAVKAHWVRHAIPADKISVIYNPVMIHSSGSVTNDLTEYDLIYVGSFIERKLVSELIDVVKVLENRLPLKLALVGDGPLKETLQNQVNSLKLNTSVSFLGYQSDAVSFIRKSKVLVLPSINEGLGRVLVEAMKVRVAVVANDDYGMREIIDTKYGQMGVLYNRSIAGDLADKLYKLITDTQLYDELVGRAYQFSHKEFSQKIYKKRFCEVLDSVEQV